MSAKDTILEAIFYTKCQGMMFLRKYITRPNRVYIADVEIKIDKEILSPDMVTTLYRGYYERAEQYILEKTLTENDIVLELGGGIGFISSLASKKLNTKKQAITVVEANPSLIPYIKENHRRNKVNALIHNCVASKEDGETHFYLAKNFWASSLEDAPGRKRITIPMKRLDNLLSETKSNYLIIDIEGGEHQLFVLDKIILPKTVNKLCIELHPTIIGDEKTSKVIQAFFNQGFTMNLSLIKNDSVIYFNRDMISS